MRPNPPLLLIVVAALAQAAPPAAPRADGGAKGDTAAIGFLRTAVDKRLYSLEAAGVARISGTAHVTFEVIVPDPNIKPTALDLELGADYASGLAAARPTKPPAADQLQIAPMAINAAQNAFSMLPSRAAVGWTTTLVPEGEMFRIDYLPPPPPADPAAAAGGAAAAPPAGPTGHWSEWHQPDGTPLLRRVTSFVPAGEGSQEITQEIVPTFEEKGGRLLLVALKPRNAAGRFSYSFEYVERDGLYLLKKLVETNEGWRLTLEFTLKAERPAAK